MIASSEPVIEDDEKKEKKENWSIMWEEEHFEAEDVTWVDKKLIS